MKAKKIFSNTYIKGGLFVIAGLLIGWLLFHSSGPKGNSSTAEVHEHSEAEQTVWTCSMHPQIRMHKPGDCPICGMDLIPLKNSNAEIDDQAIEMSESAMKLAEIQTSIVSRGAASKEVLLYGKIQMDERLQQSQTAHVPGRIEELMINVTGEQVKKGQLVAKIYSPELVTAQKELVEALSLKDKYPNLLEAAREKLRNWKLSDKQIRDIEQSGTVTSTVNIYANTSGIVTNLKVNEGDYISKGAVLFDVADLSKVWGVFDAYESDLAWISMGQSVDFTTQVIPGKTFTGKISFIDPVIDPNTRIARVRIELNNSDRKLKPEMFINGIIHSKLDINDDQISIPQTAVLWTGTRSVVYVKIPDAEHPTFKMRKITLGASMKDTYIVMDGLKEGEEIVTNGTFSVDAAAQLAGKTSMMNPSGEKQSTGNMPGMDMGNTSEMLENPDEAFTVYGNCSMCKERIETAALTVKAVKQASWNEDTKLLQLNLDKKTKVADIHKAIAHVGHDTEVETAKDEVYNSLHECCKYTRPGNMKNETLKVYGNCGMCQERIETATLELDGVFKAAWDSETKTLHLQYDPNTVSVDEVEQAIAAVGHDTENHRAPDNVYKELPECCLYDRPVKK